MNCLKLAAILFFISASAFSQNDNSLSNVPFKDRIFVGGNIGLSFGDYTYIDVSPLAGYRVTKKLQVGVGLTYIYWKDKYYNYETSIYGGRLFSRYFVFQNLFAHVEFDALNGDTWDPYTGEYLGRQTIPNLWLGGGYAQPLGGSGSALVIMLLWDVLDDPNSFYSNPTINIGVNIGL